MNQSQVSDDTMTYDTDTADELLWQAERAAGGRRAGQGWGWVMFAGIMFWGSIAAVIYFNWN